MNSLSFGLFVPVIGLLILYVVLQVAGNVLEGRSQESGGRLHDLAFGMVLLAGGYTVVLLVIGLIQYPIRMGRAAGTLLILLVFFALLVGFLLALVEVAFGGLLRRRKARRTGRPTPGSGG